MLQAILEPGMNVLDIGANIGSVMLWASHHMRLAQYIGVEPVPENIVVLKKNKLLMSIGHKKDILEAASASRLRARRSD